MDDDLSETSVQTLDSQAQFISQGTSKNPNTNQVTK